MSLRRWLRGVAVAVAILVVAEVALRLAGLGGRADPPGRFLSPEAGWAAASVYYERDPKLLWRLRPNATIVGGWYRTNRLGFRGPDPSEARAAPRVLLLGDSITFGLGLDLEDAYGTVLARLLAARLGKPIEVVLGGVPGYSSYQIARLAERTVPALRPDLVVLLAGAFNDQAPACGLDDAEVAAARRRPRTDLLRRTALWDGTRRVLGRAMPPPCEPVGARPPRPGEAPPKPRVSVRDFQANLRRVLDVARNAGAGAVAVVPPFSRKLRALQPWGERYRDAVRGLGGCRIVDADATIAARSAEPSFQPDEIHPNRIGARMVAYVVAKRIVGDHVLGRPVDEHATPPELEATVDAIFGADFGEMFVAEGRYEEALGPLRRAVLGTPDRLRPRLAYAWALLRTGDPTGAELAAQALLRRNPGLVEAHQVRAEAAAARGDEDSALEHLQTGVRADPAWVRGRSLLAAALHAKGRDGDARKHLHAGLAVSPDDPDLNKVARRLGE